MGLLWWNNFTDFAHFSSQNLPIKLLCNQSSIFKAYQRHSCKMGTPAFGASGLWIIRCAKVSGLHLFQCGSKDVLLWNIRMNSIGISEILILDLKFTPCLATRLVSKLYIATYLDTAKELTSTPILLPSHSQRWTSLAVAISSTVI